jgi:uncharacterized protein YbjT (DUF2867 family)
MNVPGISDQRDLEGLSALVTGATSGIGRAAAEELGRHGAEIVVHGRDAGRGSAVAGAITAAGGKARFVAADLTDPAQLDHLAEQAGPVGPFVQSWGRRTRPDRTRRDRQDLPAAQRHQPPARTSQPATRPRGS